MYSVYNSLKQKRKYILFIFDMVIANFSFYFAFAINNSSFSLKEKESCFLWNLLIVNICFMVIFLLFRLYDKIWRYADIEDFFYVGLASVVANVAFWIISLTFVANLGIRTYMLFLLLSTVVLFIFRLIYRLNKLLDVKNFDSSPRQRMLIVGGGESSASILRELYKASDNVYIPVCIVDDDQQKINRRIAGVKVLGSTYEIPDLCKRFDIDIILFSINRISVSDKRRILEICSKTGIEVKLVPNIYSLLANNKSVMEHLRRVEVEDLLGREPIVFDTKKYGSYITNKTVLVTGGGGSIGSELCRQIAELKPKHLVILDIYENSAYDIQQELIRKKNPNLSFEVQIASIRDIDKLDTIFKDKNFDVVFHAAAHKHVPLMETNPEEAVKNNVFGTLNLVRLADKYKIKKFVQISTDKAVNPTNIMGATKRICEMIIQDMNSKSDTEFVAVRFGNVLGSNGSVIPLFKEQIKNGGPVTVTHPDIIRYFMTIPEAVSLVLTAGGFAKGGEIFVLDMGAPVKIKDLACNLIRLSGLEPNQDIMIEYTGLRPGEKLYEELLLDEEGITKTTNKKIYIGKQIQFDTQEFENNLSILKDISSTNNKELIEKLLAKIVPTFKHNQNQKKYF